MTTMNYFREYRCMNFVKQNMTVLMDGRKGKIMRPSRGMNLKIRFDDGSTGYCHPYWRMTYFDNDGQIIKKYDE